MNTYLIISSWLNLFAALLLVTNVITSGRRNPVVFRFLLFLCSVVGWAAGYTFWRMASTEEAAFLFCKILTPFPVFVSVFFYDFALRLSGIKSLKTVILGYFLACGVVVATMMDLVVAGVSPKAGHDFWPDAGVLLPAYLVIYIGYFIASTVVLILNGQRNLGGRASNSLYILFTCFVGVVGGSTNFPLWYDVPIQPYGNGLVAIYVLLLGYGFYENRYIKVGVDFYKVFFSLSLNASAAIFYVLLYGFYRSYLREPLLAEEVWSYFFAFFLVNSALFWGIPRIKFALERVLEGVFRRERVSALEHLNELSKHVTDLVEQESIADVTAKTLIEKLNVSSVVFFYTDPFMSDYRSSFIAGELMAEVSDFCLPHDSHIIQELSREPRCLVLSQLYEEIDEAAYAELVDLKNRLHVSMIVPIFAGHEIYGFILLGAPRVQQVWSSGAVSALFNIGAQIGLNIRARDFERRSSEVDKLVALGTMAAGLAHEIRNPLVSVQTFASLLNKQKSLDNMPADFKRVLIRDIRRIESIVDGVATFSKNQQTRKSVISIRDVLDASLEIQRDALAENDVKAMVASDSSWDLQILGAHEQLAQVFNNLIENSTHALKETPGACIHFDCKLKTTNAVRSKRWIEVSVSDNGPGIPNSIRERVFDPFITSKDTGSRQSSDGMGLGLAISKRIIENHGGAISVSQSQSGGASFIISLRVHEDDDVS